MTRRAPGLRIPTPLWIAVAILAWGGLAWIAAGLLASDPPRAGFDLELLLRAGREVSAGRSPYDSAIAAGGAPDATRLFYSYPPVVGQAFALVGQVPLPVALVALALASAAGLGAVVAGLRRFFVPWIPVASAVVPAVAAAPLVLPFGVAVLFGNIDALFPFVYGAAVLGALGASRWPLVGGAALAAAAVTKIYPAGLGLWFLTRAVRDRRRGAGGPAERTLLAAIVAGCALLAVSVLVGGFGPWQDYASVARVVAGADLVDPRNMGPAAQVALLAGGGEELARTLHIGVLVLAVGAIGWAAWWLDDPVESLAVAAVATLVLLPVTWYHYPAALIPFGAAAVLRDRQPRTIGLVTGAGVLAALGIAAPVLLWVGAGLVILAANPTRPRLALRRAASPG